MAKKKVNEGEFLIDSLMLLCVNGDTSTGAWCPAIELGWVDNVENRIRLERLPARPLAIVRRRADPSQLSRIVPEACGAVWNVVRSLPIPGAGRHVAVYLDGVINLEVGVELETPFIGDGEVVGSATPAGLVAWMTHNGPYGLLHQTHEAIREWCRTNDHTVAGPNWEIYGHWQDAWNADPSKIVTEVFYLLAEGRSDRSGCLLDRSVYMMKG